MLNPERTMLHIKICTVQVSQDALQIQEASRYQTSFESSLQERTHLPWIQNSHPQAGTPCKTSSKQEIKTMLLK